MEVIKGARLWLLIIGIILSVLMALLLDATFTEWSACFITIFAMLVGGNAIHQKIKSPK